MLFRLAIAAPFAMSVSAQTESPDAVRKEIESAYTRALSAVRQAKSIEDLDEINRSFDTEDWQSIVPVRQPRGWQELRKFGFERLWATSQSTELMIDTFQLNGDMAVLTARLRNVNMKDEVAFIALKETWKKTVIGWKRHIHQKFPPGETPK